MKQCNCKKMNNSCLLSGCVSLIFNSFWPLCFTQWQAGSDLWISPFLLRCRLLFEGAYGTSFRKSIDGIVTFESLLQSLYLKTKTGRKVIIYILQDDWGFFPKRKDYGRHWFLTTYVSCTLYLAPDACLWHQMCAVYRTTLLCGKSRVYILYRDSLNWSS